MHPVDIHYICVPGEPSGSTPRATTHEDEKRRNVLRAATSSEQVSHVIREAILEEVAAFYGFSPEQRARIGLAPVPGAMAKTRAH